MRKKSSSRPKTSYNIPLLLPKTVIGTLRMHFRGFGFVQPPEGGYDESIFIPKHLTLGAIDGDLVKVEVAAVGSKVAEGKGAEGRIVEIVKRARNELFGIVIEILPHHQAHVYIPLFGAAAPPLKLLNSKKGKPAQLAIGDRIMVQVSRWGTFEKPTVGILSHFIGSIEKSEYDTQALMESYQLTADFPKEVLKEAASFGSRVAQQDLEKRADFRKWHCFTIDPETAKDFDDALSLTTTEEGGYQLGVHIADVSHYVKAGSALDKEAYQRCNSVYLPGTVVPMLPHSLSNELCSLKANVLRLTASVIMTFDATGELLDYSITKAVIRSQKRFTYGEVSEILAEKRQSPHKETLMKMAELCLKLKAKRSSRGSLQLTVPQLKIKIDGRGKPIGVEIEPYDLSHQLVEEFMLKANELVATHLAKNGKSLPFRIHDSPSPEDLNNFYTLCRTLGFALPKEPTFIELQQVIDRALQTSVGQFLITAFIRTMKLAAYSVNNVGHYGLGLQYYTHFTSPIRRYVDLIIHRTLFEENGSQEDLETMTKRCSEQERIAAKAETEGQLLKKLRYLADLPAHQIFEAIIAETKPNGIVFSIPTLLLEGFLPISEFGDDYYTFHEKSGSFTAKRTGKIYKTGTTITVCLKSLDLITLQTRWYRIESENQTREGQQKKKKRR